VGAAPFQPMATIAAALPPVLHLSSAAWAFAVEAVWPPWQSLQALPGAALAETPPVQPSVVRQPPGPQRAPARQLGSPCAGHPVFAFPPGACGGFYASFRWLSSFCKTPGARSRPGTTSAAPNRSLRLISSVERAGL
jgi:hypothetical protein